MKIELKQIKACEGGVCAAKGFCASGVYCGIRKNKTKTDLALIYSETMCNAAAVYTTNKVKGAPLVVTKQHLTASKGKARAIVCNSGNANTCNPDGQQVAQQICDIVAQSLAISAQEVLVNSTGVIGQALPIEPFEAGVLQATAALTHVAAGSTQAAQAIMTTDTKIKEFAYEFALGGKLCHIGAIGKGSGMIHPNMATMLIFITTDAAISSEMLQKALSEDIIDTFNQISVDGDTSTNDTVLLLANGLADNVQIDTQNDDYTVFAQALHAITTEMSRAIAADGEGASKLLACTVIGADTKQHARAISKSVICSDLFKAAMFGADANWGRALCAIGYTPGDFSIDGVSVTLSSKAGSVQVCENAAHHSYSEDEAAKVLQQDEIQILIDMHTGCEQAMAWGCDLTYEYVKINGDYRT